MKKLIFSLLALAAVSCTFVSCSDDELNLGPSKSESPVATAAGTYNGTWTVYDTDGVTEVATYTGSMTFSQGEAAYTANLTAAAESAFTLLNGAEAVANLAWAGDNITVVNASTSNGFVKFSKASAGTGLSGLISNGSFVVKFSLTVKVGRSSKTQFYQFKGNK